VAVGLGHEEYVAGSWRMHCCVVCDVPNRARRIGVRQRRRRMRRLDERLIVTTGPLALLAFHFLAVFLH